MHPHTSLYGYERDTTPTLKALAATSLVAENAFPNSSNTMSGLLSIYTSKYPTQTRVLYAPDILKNADAYQHMPGILKSLGYYSAQFTHAYFADAYSMNMLSAFDIANGRTIGGGIYGLINKIFTSDYAYFIYQVSTRVTDRLGHISFLSQMTSNEALVEGKAQTFPDQQKVDDIVKILAEAKQPVFIDLHWLGTHGPTFNLPGRFSQPENMWRTRDNGIPIFTMTVSLPSMPGLRGSSITWRGMANLMTRSSSSVATTTSYGRPRAGFLC